MEYRVVPFIANISNQQGAASASTQLESALNQLSSEGWEYVGLENVETYVEGSNGCFGLGAVPGRVTSYSMIVVRRR